MDDGLGAFLGQGAVGRHLPEERPEAIPAVEDLPAAGPCLLSQDRQVHRAASRLEELYQEEALPRA